MPFNPATALTFQVYMKSAETEKDAVTLQWQNNFFVQNHKLYSIIHHKYNN